MTGQHDMQHTPRLSRLGAFQGSRRGDSRRDRCRVLLAACFDLFARSQSRLRGVGDENSKRR